jgi:hypothetical protein
MLFFLYKSRLLIISQNVFQLSVVETTESKPVSDGYNVTHSANFFLALSITVSGRLEK